jgi:hypothetical protein
MKYEKIVCWVAKKHEKLMKKAFPKENMAFVNSIDEINQGENDAVVISVSKIASMKIAKKIGKLKDPYFLEKKGHWDYKMMEGMYYSEHNSMIANCEINSKLFDA